MTSFKGWKSFDFGPDKAVTKNECFAKKKESNDYNKDIITKPKKVNLKKQNFDFFEKISPKTPADLIIHPKKLQELEGWLKIVTGNETRKKTEFLLITGPTGSGKTTTVKVLCKSMNIELVEWTNPVDIDFEVFHGSNQVTKFMEFFNDSKYCSLLSKGNQKKVLMVKDFPNALVKNPEQFFESLEDISYKATHPVIFICTDLASSNINLQRLLFPDNILSKYLMSHFSFNSCAATLLKKGLLKAIDILQSHPDLFHVPSKNTVDAIISSSMGDIRCALNQLHLTCLIDIPDMPVEVSKLTTPGSKRKRSSQSGTIKQMERDEVLGLFHGLGRVLNPKRREESNSWRLNCDIQKLVDEFSIQPSKFVSFLFENYLKYFGDPDDVIKAIDILSISTCLLENWDNQEALNMALWTAVLGVMIYNEHKQSKWNQIRAPKKIIKICSTVDGLRLQPTDRYYYNLITKTEKCPTFISNI